MKNTHTEYLSSERIPTVYPELEELLPALSAEEFSALEADILANGCYAPITVNQDLVIVDGHNRFRICQEHDLPFRMQVFQLDLFLNSEKRVTPVKEITRNFNAIGDLIKNEFLPKHWRDRQEVIDVESRDAS